MSSGIIGLHSLLRWLVLFLILINIIRVFVEGAEAFESADKRWSFRLLIVTYLNTLIGVVQYFIGDKGIHLINEFGIDYALKYEDLRFWVIIHPFCMIIATILISLSHRIARRKMIVLKKHHTMLWLWFIALAFILYAIPWPFRSEEIARPLFRGIS